MERLRPAWEQLYTACAGTMFQSFAWNQLAARIFAAREAPYVVLIEDDNGSVLIPAAIREGAPHLPAFGRCGTGVSLLGEELFDYRDVLHVGDPALMRLAWEALAALHRPFRLTALRGDTAEKWSPLGHEIHICQSRAEVGHPPRSALAGDAAPVRSFCLAPQVTARQISAEAFEAKHSRSARLLRKLERQGVELKAHGGAEAALITSIYRKKAAQFTGDEANLFCDPLRVSFMVEICAQPSCEVFTLASGGTLVAALVTFVDRPEGAGENNDVAPAVAPHLPAFGRCGCRRFYTVYFDPAWAKFSPGHALIYEVTRRSLAAGMDCDFMTGEHPYKMRLATSTVPLYSVEASAETLARASREEARLAA